MFGHYRRTRRQVFLVREGSYLHKEEMMKSDLELLKSAKEVLFDVAVRQRSGVTDNGAAIVPFEILLACADMVAAIEDRLAQPEQDDGHCQACEGNYCTAKDGCVALDNPITQPEQEPVAWMFPDDLERFQTSETFAQAFSVECGSPTQGKTLPLYTAPPKPEPQVTDDMWKKLSELQQKVMEIAHTTHPHREWVGLNPKEISEIAMYCQNENPAFFALEVESKLKEKNT